MARFLVKIESMTRSELHSESIRMASAVVRSSPLNYTGACRSNKFLKAIHNEIKLRDSK